MINIRIHILTVHYEIIDCIAHTEDIFPRNGKAGLRINIPFRRAKTSKLFDERSMQKRLPATEGHTSAGRAEIQIIYTDSLIQFRYGHMFRRGFSKQFLVYTIMAGKRTSASCHKCCHTFTVCFHPEPVKTDQRITQLVHNMLLQGQATVLAWSSDPPIKVYFQTSPHEILEEVSHSSSGKAYSPSVT